MQRISAPMPFGEKQTHKSGGNPFLMPDVRCQPLDRAAFAKRQRSPNNVPVDDIGPRSPKAHRAQIHEGRQTACPVLAAIAGEMTRLSCFKCFSFLGKAYGTSSHLLQWRLRLPSTQCPHQFPCIDLGRRRPVSPPRTRSLLLGMLSPICTLLRAGPDCVRCWHLTKQTCNY